MIDTTSPVISLGSLAGSMDVTNAPSWVLKNEMQNEITSY